MPRDPIRQLDEAVAEVFAVMLNLACASEPTVPGTCGSAATPCWYAASVRFSGTLEGVCTVYLSERTAAELTANLAGIPPAEVPKELCADTAGELCNMIAGSWKTRQPSDRAACNLSCPTVSAGFPTQIIPGDFAHSVTLLYHFAGMHMTLQLAFN